MQNLEKELVAVIPNKQTHIVECFYEDGTTTKFRFVEGNGFTWEEVLAPLQTFIVNKH